MNVQELKALGAEMKIDLAFIMGYFKLDQPFKATATADSYDRCLYLELSLKKKQERRRLCGWYFSQKKGSEEAKFESLLAKAFDAKKVFKW